MGAYSTSGGNGVVTLSLELNNPGNLEFTTIDKWQGLATPPFSGKFFSFTTAVYGIRALAITLVTAQDKHNLRTIAEMVPHYAPASDGNNVEAYIADLCRRTSFDRDKELDLHSYECQRALVPAFIWHEQGLMPYSAAQIDQGLKLAGIVPEVPRSTAAAIARDPAAIATTIAATAGGAQATVSSVSSIWDSLAAHIDPRYLVWSCVAVALGFAAYHVYAIIKARKEGRA